MKPVQDLERLLKALANRRRLTILMLLQKKKELDVTDTAAGIKLSFTSTSKHLRILEIAGILEKRQSNLNVYYRITKKQHPLLPIIFKLLSNR